MSKQDDGGPAFPQPALDWEVSPDDEGYLVNASNDETRTVGMSLRDYLAGQALAGRRASDTDESCLTSAQAAEMAYEDADAMLEARKR